MYPAFNRKRLTAAPAGKAKALSVAIALGQGVLLHEHEYQALLRLSGQLDDILDAEIIE